MLDLNKISGYSLNRKLSRANNAVRMMRIHAYLCVLYVFPTFTLDLIVFSRPSFPLFFAAAGGVIGISSGLRDSSQGKTRGPVLASIGLMLAAYVSLGHFFFPEQNLGFISAVHRTDTDFRIAQFLALAFYGATLAFSIFCVFGLTDRVVADHHAGLGLDQSASRSLSFICLGTFGRPGAKLNPKGFPAAAMAFLFFGWAFYVLYCIPLGFFAISNAAEIQRIMGFDTFILTQIPITLIKIGLVILLLGIARKFAVKARQIVTDAEAGEVFRSRRLGVLYLGRRLISTK